MLSRRNKVRLKNPNNDDVESSPMSVGSIIGVGSVGLAITLLCLWTYLASEHRSDAIVPESSPASVNTPAVTSGGLAISEKPDIEKASNTASVTEFLAEYFKTRNWNERLPLVRQTPHIEDRMRRWYGWHQDGPLTHVAAEAKATDIGGYLVVKLHGKNLPSDHIVLEKTLGGYRVDWESFVIYQDLDWSDIQKEKSRGARMIRAMIEPVQNQHKVWTAEKGFRCYKLIQPRTGEVFFSYFNSRHTDLTDPGVEALLNSPKGRFTLEVYYPEKSKSELDVLISRVITKGWVIK